ncbi:hypothetical protein [Rhodopirellula europaea]|uniref:hypothetical protein n=1 Tax=Rhodopirellula europaea TaxID=1263866 RepID=UPI003D2D7B11
MELIHCVPTSFCEANDNPDTNDKLADLHMLLMKNDKATYVPTLFERLTLEETMAFS